MVGMGVRVGLAVAGATVGKMIIGAAVGGMMGGLVGIVSDVAGSGRIISPDVGCMRVGVVVAVGVGVGVELRTIEADKVPRIMARGVKVGVE
jgi:hypothetical protein